MFVCAKLAFDVGTAHTFWQINMFHMGCNLQPDTSWYFVFECSHMREWGHRKSLEQYFLYWYCMNSLKPYNVLRPAPTQDAIEIIWCPNVPRKQAAAIFYMFCHILLLLNCCFSVLTHSDLYHPVPVLYQALKMMMMLTWAMSSWLALRMELLS